MLFRSISRRFRRPIQKLSSLLGMDETGGAALIACLASFFPTLDMIPKMNEKARLLVLTFGISASYVFGDHLGFTAGVCQDMVLPMIVSKLAAAISAMLLANLFANKLLKDQ